MMRESDLLAHIYQRAESIAQGDVLVGPGDDCAVVRLGESSALLTTDQLIEHRHFAHDTPIDLIARKAMARSISDIAAMGGTPRFALATACLPAGYPHADALFDAMHRWALHWACPLVGGDIASHDGPLVLTVTVVGEPHAVRGPVLRSGARVGDAVWVTGALGGSFASGRHLRFTPRVRESHALCNALGPRLHAMIDISDGAGRDAARIAHASGCGIELDESLLPRHAGVSDWRSALGDGEDYELLFTAAPELVMPSDAHVTRVGRCIAGTGCVLVDRAGMRHDVSSLGWDHAT